MNKHIKEQIETLNKQVKELTGIYNQSAVRSGITNNEFWVWYSLLILDEEYSQQDICEMWSLPKQTINSVIANLSKKGYVFLEVVPGTRNRKIIRVTELGKEVGENIIRHIFEAERRTIERLSEEERQSCITLLGKYIGILKEELYEK